MRICIFGAGALGSALAGLLANENDVTVIGRKEHVRAIRKNGLILTGDARRVVKLKALENVISARPPDLLLITTKAYDTPEAVDECRAWAARDTEVLTLQNGLGNLEIIRRWKGEKAFGGTTTLGASLLSPGKVRISGLGKTSIGAETDREGAQRIADVFRASGLKASTVPDMRSEIWAKAVISSSINPLTAILRVRNGLLLESKWISKLMDAVLEECLAVAAQEGVRLSSTTVRARAQAVLRDTARNHSSMLQDILKGRRTEIGQINGAFVEYGRAHHVATPLNGMLTATIESMAADNQTMQKVNIATSCIPEP